MKGRHRIAHRCVRRRRLEPFLQLAVKPAELREKSQKLAKRQNSVALARLHHLASRGASEQTFLLLVARLGNTGSRFGENLMYYVSSIF